MFSKRTSPIDRVFGPYENSPFSDSSESDPPANTIYLSMVVASKVLAVLLMVDESNLSTEVVKERERDQENENVDQRPISTILPWIYNDTGNRAKETYELTVTRTRTLCYRLVERTGRATIF